MAIAFHKMHGLGNDFVILDERAAPLPITPRRAAALADRHTGIGCDQLIRLLPADDAAARMRIQNADGSDAQSCGNATRCVALLLHQETGANPITLRSPAGLLVAEITPAGQIRVEMGAPRFGWQDIPLARDEDTRALPIAAPPLARPAACSMGNPHATFFVPDLGAIDLARLGPILEQDRLFPQRANIGVAQILAPDRMRLRVFERGAGLTRACGSGACAALVNAVRLGLSARSATIVLDGGTLGVDWHLSGSVFMTGPAAGIFTGAVTLEDFPP